MPSDFEPFLNQTLDPTEEGSTPSIRASVALGDLAEQGQWQDVAGRVQELLAARIYDIRPLSYYFFGAFHEGGLSEGRTGVRRRGTPRSARNFASIGPSKRREHQFDKRLLWLFEKMLEVIEYHELKRSPEWDAWHKALGEGAIERAIASGRPPRADHGRAQLPAFAESPRASSARCSHGSAVTSSLPPAPPKKKTEPPPPVVEKPKKLPEARDEAALEADDVALEALQRRVELVVSHKFTLLMSKLKAFDVLVEKGDFTKAARSSRRTSIRSSKTSTRATTSRSSSLASARSSASTSALTDQPRAARVAAVEGARAVLSRRSEVVRRRVTA